MLFSKIQDEFTFELLFRAAVSFILLALPVQTIAADKQALGPDFSVSNDQFSKEKKHYSPYVNSSYPNRVFWGDTHLHTSYSWDAGLVGNTLGPDEAYRFAKGEQVIASSGQPVKLIRPLDWLVVADHAESLGAAVMIERSDPEILKSEVGRKVHDLYKEGDIYGAFETWGFHAIIKGDDPLKNPQLTRTMWEEIIEHTENHYEPGKFTTFMGYEWSSSPEGNNLHRVVVMRDGANEVKRILPFAASESSDPEKLWEWMANYEEKVGGRVLAIPHNGNLSNGAMFSIETMGGKPIDKNYSERRARWEPLYEVTQMKGDGEAHPFLSPDDEFADYENWDKGNWAGERKRPDMLPYEYARGALKVGLQMEQKLGANPFKFGMVGATDSHTSLATTREENNFGKVSTMEPGSDRFSNQIVPDPEGAGTSTYEYETLASGLQGIWSIENSREALWDAMKRKETYATTGTRISVRIFAGWDFEEADVQRPDFAKNGYLGGVPMGGDLKSAPTAKEPRLIIRALRDPDGANLDRIQVIKGWLDSDSKMQERVFDVVCSDNRAVQNHSCEKPVGNTVDIKKATYANSIGDALLMGYWKDPDFNPEQRAFYYVRVLEIPTPRWTTYDAAFYGIDLPDSVPPDQQERAYTSPVWYTP